MQRKRKCEFSPSMLWDKYCCLKLMEGKSGYQDYIHSGWEQLVSISDGYKK